MAFIRRSESLPSTCVFFSEENTPSCLPFQRKLLFSGKETASTSAHAPSRAKSGHRQPVGELCGLIETASCFVADDVIDG